MKPRTLIALSLLAAAPSAQSVQFRGKVENVSGTQNRFVLDCTSTRLESATIDLNAFVGSQVAIGGQWNGSRTSPSVLVETIQVVPELFEIGGGAKIGDTSTLGVTGTPGDLALGFLSTGTGFLPLDGGSSVVFLDLTGIVVRRTGVVGGTGVLEMPFFIPNNLSLVGLEIYGQGALTNASGRTITNPDCKTISS